MEIFAAAVGTRVLEDVATVGAGDAAMELASPEGPATPVEADAGTLGAQVVLSGTVPDGCVR
ncbi:MAG TPA: hypothetical protein PLZ92_14805, partial [Phycicoccus sp.]|nr:hypothetical protein [Phycicoccus sp.]